MAFIYSSLRLSNFSHVYWIYIFSVKCIYKRFAHYSPESWYLYKCSGHECFVSYMCCNTLSKCVFFILSILPFSFGKEFLILVSSKLSILFFDFCSFLTCFRKISQPQICNDIQHNSRFNILYLLKIFNQPAFNFISGMKRGLNSFLDIIANCPNFFMKCPSFPQ